ncbi:hypothetical protein FRC10_011141 [Ceratobasidium sp. 414]|nr:hypothetical protein FRC10_011141 [Ceratobasidium sp. 414]
MLELLKRFEEEAVGDTDQEEDIDDIASRLQGIDLDTVNHDTLWELLTEGERQKFLQMIANPGSDESKQILDAKELTDKPWWDPEAISEGKAPAIRPVPQNMLGSSRFNPMLLFNPPPATLVRLLLADSKTLFRTRPVVDTTEDTQNSAHDSCMRFLSDILCLVDSSKKHAHIGLKLTFYLALIARLPAQASKDLINAIRMWEAKTQVDEQVIEPPARRKVVIEELG